MSTSEIIAGIDEQIERLESARHALTAVEGGDTNRAVHHRTVTHAKRTISPAGRKRIAAAQRARWAKQKKEARAKARKKAVKHHKGPKVVPVAA